MCKNLPSPFSLFGFDFRVSTTIYSLHNLRKIHAMASSLAPYEAMDPNIQLFPRFEGSRRPRVLLAATGCVAAVRFEHMCISFQQWTDVVAVVSVPSVRFMGQTHLPNDLFVYGDGDEWIFWKKPGDPMLHTFLQDWADVMVIAPLSANTLAKITGGISNTLLTTIVRGWNYEKPIYVAPAMNSLMWVSRMSEKHKATLAEMGINIIQPGSFVCKPGTGSMAEESEIIHTVKLYWSNKHYPPGHTPRC